jgi:hypothetical protein
MGFGWVEWEWCVRIAVKSGVLVVLKHERVHCRQQVRVTTNLWSETTGVQSSLQGSVQKSILSC